MFVVNFFGGPGCGKSTTAASLFSYLKMSDLNCELVTEFAKDLTWDQSMAPLSFQPYVFGQQSWRIERLRGKVDVVVTDSPIILSSIYASPEIPECFHDYVLWEHNRTPSLNFLLRRVKKFNPVGRNQTEEESQNLDLAIADKLKEKNITFEEVLTGDGTAPIKAFSIVMRKWQEFSKMEKVNDRD
jgi:nicotinamide riboside kinase